MKPLSRSREAQACRVKSRTKELNAALAWCKLPRRDAETWSALS